MRIPEVLTALVLVGSGVASAQSQLSIAGQPYFDGGMTLSVTAPSSVGQPVLLVVGLTPLPLNAPLHSSKGPFFIGSLISVIPLGTIAANGRIDYSFILPAYDPGLAGIPIALQGYVSGQLSNPATLPLDTEYYVPANAIVLESPNPTNVGKFGDQIAVGDLNGDGARDVVVGAWFEDTTGVDRSGRVYVFWGPTLGTVVTLEPPSPKAFGLFGLGLAVADFDGDAVDDIVIAEGTGSPSPPGQSGTLYLFQGGSTFSRSPAAMMSGTGTGPAYEIFGRVMAVADFNHDDFPDIAVGLPGVPNLGFSNAGQVDVYWGPTFASVLHLSSPDVGQDDFFGTDLTTADVNGDGVSDLIEGNGRETVGGVFGIGRVYLFTGPSLLHFKTIENPLPDGTNSRFGNAVVGKDIDGDGIAEVITTDERNHGYIFWSPTYDEYHVITRPPDPVSGSGISVSFGYFAAVGDVNADALNDVVIADPFAGSKGKVFIALGPYFSDFHVLQDMTPTVPAEFGWGVTVSDVDGDGRVELLVGSDLATASGVLGAGHVTVFDYNP